MATPFSNQISLWDQLENEESLAEVLQTALQNSGEGLSQMVGRPINIDVPKVKRVPISQVVNYVGSPETEMVGIYMLIEGDWSGQVILMMTHSEALYLVDMILDLPAGTTTQLEDLECSALAEACNIMTSFFVVKVFALTGSASRPSPSAVLMDMLGAIMNVVVTPVASQSDSLLIMEAAISDPSRVVLANFWVLPYSKDY